MRAFGLAIVATLLAMGASAGEMPDRSTALVGCQALDVCMTRLDHVTHFANDSGVGDEAAIAANLRRFGEPAKQALLAKGVDGDAMWSLFAENILAAWPDFTDADVPKLAVILLRNPGSWIANNIGRIGTPDAIRALMEDVRLHDGKSQSEFALKALGDKTDPYLLEFLAHDAGWTQAQMLFDGRHPHFATMAGDWIATATGNGTTDRRVAALRALSFLGSEIAAQAPPLRPLLQDREPAIRQAAAFTLRAMGDASTLGIAARECRGVRIDGKPDPFASLGYETPCIFEVAAGGLAARPYGRIVARNFLASPNGSDRANGAATLGYIGDDGAIPQLIALLGDADWRVVAAAARSLGWLHARAAKAALARVARHHWLDAVRETAAAARAAMVPGAAPLARPQPRGGSVERLPTVPIAINNWYVHDAPACGPHWRFRNLRFDWQEGRDIHPVRVGDGEVSGALNNDRLFDPLWRAHGSERPLGTHDAAVVGIERAGPGAVAAFAEWGEDWSYDHTPPPVPDIETVGIPTGPDAYGYVLAIMPGARGGPRMREIVRLPRVPDLLKTIAPGLYVVWSGGRAIVFSLKGVEGLATCDT